MRTITAETASHVTIDPKRVAEEGERYTDQFLGLDVVYVTSEGARLWGKVESFDPTCAGRAIIRFTNGQWAFANETARLVVSE